MAPLAETLSYPKDFSSLDVHNPKRYYAKRFCQKINTELITEVLKVMENIYVQEIPWISLKSKSTI